MLMNLTIETEKLQILVAFCYPFGWRLLPFWFTFGWRLVGVWLNFAT